MRSMPVVIAVAAGGLLLTAAPAAADPPRGVGGCQAFGANVASLGQALGPAFGATASGVASSAPRAFPTVVVFPEQRERCG